MATMLIRNGRLIDPGQGLDGQYDILIRDGRVDTVEPGLSKTMAIHIDRVVEARDLIVAPGLVDMHVHLRDPGYTEKEDVYTGCNAALAGGVTSLLCMPNTNPPIDNPETIEYLRQRVEGAKARVYLCGAATRGLRGRELGDYELYREQGVIAVSDDGRPVSDETMMEQVMQEAARYGLRVVSHCEDLEIVRGGIMNRGTVSEELGVKGMDRSSEDNMTQREIGIAERTGAPVHICHVSTAGAVEAIRQAKARGVRVTAETCPHYFAYTDEKLRGRDADYRMNPPLREPKDVEAIIQGLQDGTIDCIVTDHAPHTKWDKRDFLKAPNGVVGLETSLAAGIRFLVEPGHLSMPQLLEKMTAAPAGILGIPAGSLRPGMPADLILLDPRVVWTVLPERLQSKSKNTAFKFERLQGRVKYTFVGGNLAYVMRY